MVVLVDELAFLTAYQPERDLRKRAEAAIATLTSQGRSVGVCVVGALQDPRKDVISLRNLFSTRIALRLDESDQVDMVLGDGARDRGALADQISPAALRRGRGRVRAAGGLARPGTGPRRLRHRRRHHGHGRRGRLPARRWPDEGNRLAHRRTLPRLRRPGWSWSTPAARCCGPNAACAATPGRSTPKAPTGTVPGDRGADDAGRADGRSRWPATW